MKIALFSLTCILLGAITYAASTSETSGFVSKEKAMKRFTTLCDESEVVALVRVESNKEMRVFTCIEVWKATGDRPTVGESFEFASKQRYSDEQPQALLFLPKYPVDRLWTALSLSEGKLGMCPELSIGDLRNALAEKKG